MKLLNERKDGWDDWRIQRAVDKRERQQLRNIRWVKAGGARYYG